MEHSGEVKTAIEYIERRLGTEIRVDDVAEAAGFSKFHFCRIFKAETGLTVYEYVQRRRLARGAYLLLHGSVSVLDIALELCFGSQEVFSRAFKRVYGLPPGRYRRALANLIYGGIDMCKKPEMKGWFFAGTAPEKYRSGTDHEVFNSGACSGFIESTAEEYMVGEYATLMQQFSSKTFIGRRMRFSAFVKTEHVEGWAGLWMRLDHRLGGSLTLDNMQNRPITGTREWNIYSCVLDVPEETEIINIGFLLSGRGKIWVDDASFQQVDESVPTTDFRLRDEYPEEPEILDFEE